MILTEKIIVGLGGTNIQYFRDKGYDLTPFLHKNDKGKDVILMGSKLEVLVSDLPHGSCYKVLAKCDNPECGKERLVEFNKYTSLCHKCVLQTESYKINNGNANRGKKRTEEQKERMRRPYFSVRKEKNVRWDKNKSEEDRNIQHEKSRNYPEYKDWRLAVFRKDGYQCQRCGYIGKKINAHHIESYYYNKELRINIDNGIVLCKSCHQLFHSTYGKTGTHRYQMEEFLKNRELLGFIKREYEPDNLTRQGSKDVNNSSSRFVGVSKNKKRKNWNGRFYYAGIRYDLGQFKCEVEAAMAYNEAAIELIGYKAHLNKITEEEIKELWEQE
jgi:5-methylcytosine-specific restriction endonuclease McrA